MELAPGVVEHAHLFAIEKAHGENPLAERVPVGAGISVDRRPDPSGNPGQRLQPRQPAPIGEVHQVLQDRARFHRHQRAFRRDVLAVVAQHQAAETVVGNDQVGAAANYHHGHAGRARRMNR